MIRHVERLRQAAPRLFVAMHLGMPPMRVPARTIGVP
jgi:hypothetical protein